MPVVEKETGTLGPTTRRQVRLPIWVDEAVKARARMEMCTPSDIIRRALMRTLFSPDNGNELTTMRANPHHREEGS